LKYRLNFVSNSSSQAHIVLFPRVPESPLDVQGILGNISIGEAEMLHVSILAQHPNSIGAIISQLETLAWLANYQFERFGSDQTKLERAVSQAIFHARCMNFISRSFQELVEKMGDGVYYIFEYDDDTGDMKWHNGDVFDNVYSVAISHH